MDEAAEVPQIAFAGRVQYRTRAQEQQALHERMVHGVIHDGNQGERRGSAHADTGEYDRQPEAGKQDPDVFDGGIGEQPLHVGLRSRENDPVQRAEQPERERHQTPPPHGLSQ